MVYVCGVSTVPCIRKDRPNMRDDAEGLTNEEGAYFLYHAHVHLVQVLQLPNKKRSHIRPTGNPQFADVIGNHVVVHGVE